MLQSRPLDRFQNGQDVLVALRGQLYRDRGAYLTEFCEFFFGSIHAMDPTPSIDDFADLGPVLSAGGSRKRKSIEERLRASMALDAEAKKVLGAQESAAVETHASSAQGSKIAGKSKVKTIGERRPDETGMLSMESLSESLDQPEDSKNANATEFWALPTTSVDRAKPVPPPPVPGARNAPPPPPGSPVAAPAPPAPSGPVPVAPPLTSGGIAVDSGAPSRTPFRAGQGAPSATPPSNTQFEKRVQSNRIYAIWVGVVVVLFGLLLVALFGDWSEKEQAAAQVESSATSTSSSVKRTVDRDRPNNDDTGFEAPPVRQTTRAPRTGTRPASSSRPAKPTGPRVAGGSVLVKLADTSQASGVELVCGAGSYRLRKSFAGGVANFSGVPGGQCTLYFKGGIPAKFTPVVRGKSYNCSIVGTTAVCK